MKNIYSLEINKHNIKPHLDIESDIQSKKDGLFTFNLRVSQSNIEDYAQFRTVTIHEYRSVTFTIAKQPSIPRDPGTGGEENAVRPDKR